jgi:uncharacterized protein
VFAAIMMIVIIWIVMWGFYKFMYPRAPKSMMPQKGDVTTPRNCDFCGNSLAEYRGVLETNTVILASDTDTNATVNATNAIDDVDTSATINAEQQLDKVAASNQLFFCNYEHQADYHAGRSYP